MMENSRLLIKTETIKVSAVSKKSYKDAYNDCFAAMRKEITSPEDQVIVQISLLDISNINESTTERKRGTLDVTPKNKRMSYFVEMDLIVEIKYIKIKEDK